jgi:hypothetical protein
LPFLQKTTHHDRQVTGFACKRFPVCSETASGMEAE